MPKSVKFNSIVRVSLIHTRGEYKQHGLSDHIWWSQNELAEIRKDILREIRDLMAQYPDKSFDDCQNEILQKHT